ncbi:MAG TPA: hypothetical protein VF889_00470 [Bacteroidota bacterium]
MRKILFLLALGSALTASMATAACDPDSPAAAAGRGLRFQSGVLPAASAEGSQLLVWLGTGYDFGDRFGVEILFYTGHLHVGPAPHRPVTGTLLLGGASLELRSRLLEVGPAAVVAGGEGGLFTTLTQSGSGYNGSGASLFGGVEFSIFRGLEAAPIVRCGWWSWRNGVGSGVEPFDAFTQFWYGAGLTLTFRPDL